jgi:hypothetical protein
MQKGLPVRCSILVAPYVRGMNHCTRAARARHQACACHHSALNGFCMGGGRMEAGTSLVTICLIQRAGDLSMKTSRKLRSSAAFVLRILARPARTFPEFLSGKFLLAQHESQTVCPRIWVQVPKEKFCCGGGRERSRLWFCDWVRLGKNLRSKEKRSQNLACKRYRLSQLGVVRSSCRGTGWDAIPLLHLL